MDTRLRSRRHRHADYGGEIVVAEPAEDAARPGQGELHRGDLEMEEGVSVSFAVTVVACHNFFP